MVLRTSSIAPGLRIRITQQIPRMRGVWTNTVEGILVQTGQAKTGSWFAHAKDHKLWINRLELRLDDGELVVVNLDQYSHIEVVDPAHTTHTRMDDASNRHA